MPIVEIEIVLRPGEKLNDNAAGVIADELGIILGSHPGQTWVKLHTLAPERYAENGVNPLLYLPPAAGRIAFGGKIVPKT